MEYVLIPLVLGLLIFMMMRQRRQQRSYQDLLAHLAPGQEVMTGSGLFGTVVDIDPDNDVVVLETSPGVHSRWLRPAIRRVIVEQTAEADAIEAPVGANLAPEAIVVPDDLSSLSDQPAQESSGTDDDGPSEPRRSGETDPHS